MICRACASSDTVRVLDLGKAPAADFFPLAEDPVSTSETTHDLAMDLCRVCGLAQLADDDTVTDEPRGVEPQALRDQAEDAIARVAAAGWLRGTTVIEFGSPHGGTWVPLLLERGFSEAVADSAAAVVLDCFGIMHEPDQRAAFARRAAATARDGVLLLQFHSLAAIVQQGQWNALRHGHFGYYSLTALTALLRDAGMHVHAAWEFDLYGGTVLIAARHDEVEPDEYVTTILSAEAAMGLQDPHVVAALQRAASAETKALDEWLDHEVAGGRRVYAYGAASRAVALFALAGVNASRLTAVADAAPAKQGRRMPGTDVPIISPESLVAAAPDTVLLTLPDLLPEVRRRYPEISDRLTLGPA
ncbi:class I SAM-dependent methyltransferase [Antrihabitans spumae]|uniref:Class I SAM-dependent methyltransferase n=1 Tax=Antrihabitans spumae TaxID=3373370 RepID=A0ABW7KR13_9NOCA